MKRWTSPPLPVPDLDTTRISRADAVFTGVDHSAESYEARVYVGNQRANLETGLDPERGYAGSFTIFGHGGCFGDDPDHCNPEKGYRDEFDMRPPHPLTPQTKTVRITDALKGRASGEQVYITVVAVDQSGEEPKQSDAMDFEELRLLVYTD
jgi:tyrosinase